MSTIVSKAGILNYLKAKKEFSVGDTVRLQMTARPRDWNGREDNSTAKVVEIIGDNRLVVDRDLRNSTQWAAGDVVLVRRARKPVEK